MRVGDVSRHELEAPKHWSNLIGWLSVSLPESGWTGAALCGATVDRPKTNFVNNCGRITTTTLF